MMLLRAKYARAEHILGAMHLQCAGIVHLVLLLQFQEVVFARAVDQGRLQIPLD